MCQEMALRLYETQLEASSLRSKVKAPKTCMSVIQELLPHGRICIFFVVVVTFLPSF